MRTPTIAEIYECIRTADGLKLPEIARRLCPDLTEGEIPTAKSNIRSKLSRLVK